jgi:hypothetical protein
MKKSLYLLAIPCAAVLLYTAPMNARLDQVEEEPIVAPGGPGFVPATQGMKPTIPGTPGATMPQMTEAELLKWQQEVDKEINNFVSTLSPKDQEQFHKDVAELTTKMSNMTEDELVEFLGTVFPEEPQPTPEPTPVEEPTAPVVVEKVVEDKDETHKAVKLLGNLITRTERFLRKSTQIPEFAGKIQEWIRKDLIKEWQSDLTWNTLKADIESLNSQFHTLKESLDPKTKKSRYLTDLMKDESLFNNLSTLSARLTTHESKVEAPEFGEGKVSTTSLNAIKEVLSAFAEAVYTLELPDALEKLIELYEPRAKTLREEQEGHKKRAHEESKKVATQVPTREAHSIGHGGSPSAAGPESAYYGGGYTGGGYSPSYAPAPSYSDYGVPYEPYYSAPASHGGGYAAGGVPAADKESASAPQPGDEKGAAVKPGSTFGGLSTASGKAGKSDAPVQKTVEEDPEIMRSFNKLETTLSGIDAIFEEQETLLKNLDKHMGDAKQPASIELADALQRLSVPLKKVTSSIKTIKKSFVAKGLTPQQKEYYTKKFKPNLKERLPLLSGLGEELGKIKKRGVSGVSDAKQYLYLGNTHVKDKAKEAPEFKDMEELPKPIDLKKLAKELEEFSEEVQGLLK